MTVEKSEVAAGYCHHLEPLVQPSSRELACWRVDSVDPVGVHAKEAVAPLMVQRNLPIACIDDLSSSTARPKKVQTS